MKRFSRGARWAPVSLAVSLALAPAAGLAQAAAAATGDTAATPAPSDATQKQETTARNSAASRKAAASTSSESTGLLQEVVVRGITGGIENSLQAERLSNEIVEVVSAEDIGKLPSPSIAESLARLPSVMAERGNDGFSDKISIRGLSPDFVGTLVNGRVQATTGENWGVSFNQIPAELVSGATVYLTPNAQLIGQGLAGTIDVHTIDPLKYNTHKLTLSANGSYLSNPSLVGGAGVGRAGGQASGTFIDQFFDHKLGLAIGVEHADTPIQEETYQNWWWSLDEGSGGIEANWGGPHTAGIPDNVLSQEGMQLRSNSERWKRDALMGILEFAPSDSFDSKLQLFYSTVGQTRYIDGLQWSSSPYDNISYSNVQTQSFPGLPYPLATSGTIMGLKPIMQNEYTHTRFDLMSAGWTNDIRLAGEWHVKTDLSYSRATESLNDAYAFTGLPGGATLDSQFSIGNGWGFGNFTPSVDLNNPANVVFTDPDNYSYDGRAEQDYQIDRIMAARLDVSHPLGWIFSDVHAGIYYADRKKTKNANVWFAFLNGNGSDSSTYQNNFYAPIGANELRPSTSIAYGGVGSIVNYNVLGALASQFYLVPENGEGDWDRNYTVELKTPTAYLMADIDTDLLGIPVRGNVGAQMVRTEQSSVALQTNGNSVVGALRGGLTYNNVLPSLNLVAQLPDQNYLRLGVAKEMVYGRIDDIRASASASPAVITTGPGTGQVQWSGNGGNPQLRPYLAVGYDVGWTKYFGNSATYLQLNGFQKKLLNYIYDQTILNYDFSGYTNPDPTIVPTSNIGPFTEPENGTGGKLYGGTIAGGLNLGMLVHFVRGLGVEGSYTRINSNLPTSTISQIPGGPQTLPGLSRDSGSLTVYFERGGFSARLAEIYRSEYTGEAVALFDQLGYTKVLAYKEADVQANYAFDSGALQGLTLLLDVSNLTNEPFRSVQVSGLPNNVVVPMPLEFDSWGRTYSLGFRYAVW